MERITKKGVVAGGVEYEVDCIIFSTGFEVGTAWTRRQGYDVVGKDGKSLSEYWANGMKTLHGFFSHGFPNYFLMGATQNGASVNITSVLDDQAQHIHGQAALPPVHPFPRVVARRGCRDPGRRVHALGVQHDQARVS